MSAHIWTSRDLDPQLECFTLDKHGDRLERKLWPHIRDEFPLYEILWRRYIVPLTRRLESGLSFARCIRLRPDMGTFEHLAMSHYSVFRSFGKATARLASRDDEDRLARDVFVLLDTGLESVKAFFAQLDQISKLIDARFVLKPPKHDKEFPELKEMADYRNILLHYPVLGRAEGQGVEMIPVYEELDNVKGSWLQCELLPPDRFVETRALLKRYRSRYSVYLNTRWDEILSVLDNSRDKYVRRLRLGERSGITTGPVAFDPNLMQSNTNNPVAASGQFVLDVQARSDTCNFAP